MAASSVQPFGSEGEYRAAIDAVIAVARQELCIFDADLFRIRLEERERATALEAFLAVGGGRRVRLVLRDTTRLESSSPRLLTLLRRYPERLAFRLVPENLAHLADCLVLADGVHGVIRFHADHARGKQVMADPEELAPRLARFEELWELSSPWDGGSRTGL